MIVSPLRFRFFVASILVVALLSIMLVSGSAGRPLSPPEAGGFPTAAAVPAAGPLRGRRFETEALANQLSYTALGDSIGAGQVDSQGGYVLRYQNYIQTDTGASVTLHNLSVSGWTSGDLLNAIHTDPNFGANILNSQVIAFEIGGNDLLNQIDSYQNGTCGGSDNQDCLRNALATFKTNYTSIVTEILNRRSTSNTIIRTMDIYDPFVNQLMARGLFSTIKPYLDAFNQHIANTALANNFPYARVAQAFNGPNGDQDAGDKGYLASDGIHPNDAGHKVIADLLRALGYAPLFALTPTPTPTPTPTATATPTPTPASIVQFNQANYNVVEANTALTLTVTRSGDTSAPATVDYATADGSAHQSNKYTISSGTLSFAAGQASQSFSILVNQESYVEGSVTFNMTLSHPSTGLSIGAPGTATVTIMDDDTVNPPTSNVIDDPSDFIHQLYHDFLARVPDDSGLSYWAGQITQCGSDQNCVHTRRVGVADAFFFEPEFQQTGGYVYDLYKAAFGSQPLYGQFMPDRAQVVGGASLDQSKTEFATAFIQRSAFTSQYPLSLAGGDFLDAVLTTIRTKDGVDLTAHRADYLNAYNGGSDQAHSRGLALRAIAETPAFIDSQYSESFVVMEYFGYLRRDPDAAGESFWLGQVNRRPLRDVAIQQAMACSFITSIEYQQRFSSLVTHTNQECPQ